MLGTCERLAAITRNGAKFGDDGCLVARRLPLRSLTLHSTKPMAHYHDNEGPLVLYPLLPPHTPTTSTPGASRVPHLRRASAETPRPSTSYSRRGMLASRAQILDEVVNLRRAAIGERLRSSSSGERRGNLVVQESLPSYDTASSSTVCQVVANYAARRDTTHTASHPKRVVSIAVDGSVEAHQALEWALETYVRKDGEDTIELVNVRRPVRTVFEPEDLGVARFAEYLYKLDKMERIRSFDLLQSLAEDVHKKGFAVQAVVLTGDDPGKTLCAYMAAKAQASSLNMLDPQRQHRAVTTSGIVQQEIPGIMTALNSIDRLDMTRMDGDDSHGDIEVTRMDTDMFRPFTAPFPNQHVRSMSSPDAFLQRDRFSSVCTATPVDVFAVSHPTEGRISEDDETEDSQSTPTEMPAPPCHVLIVGSRGRGRFKRLILGSTAHYCARNARVPVVVVRWRRHHRDKNGKPILKVEEGGLRDVERGKIKVERGWRRASLDVGTKSDTMLPWRFGLS